METAVFQGDGRRDSQRMSLARAALLNVAWLASACGSRVGEDFTDAAALADAALETSIETSADIAPVTCDAPARVFGVHCALSGCHTAADAPSSGGLDLQSPSAFARLNGVRARGGAGLIINTADPDRSILYVKTASPAPFGARMPLGQPQIASDLRACILDWLVRGG